MSGFAAPRVFTASGAGEPPGPRDSGGAKLCNLSVIFFVCGQRFLISLTPIVLILFFRFTEGKFGAFGAMNAGIDLLEKS